MRVSELVKEYVAFKRALGFLFQTNEHLLQAFSRSVGEQTEIAEVSGEQILKFLHGTGPLTRTWHGKHNALTGLYRYAISRDYLQQSPLPKVVPKLPPTIVPYIYSHEELKRLIAATNSYQRHRSSLAPATVRVMLLLLYGAGLRGCEAVSLKLGDVDLPNALMTIRNTKFNKSRLVPLGQQLTQELVDYAEDRKRSGHALDDDAPFFVLRTGAVVNHNTLQGAFQRLREQAGIQRHDGARYQPRLHDLRHTFAIHRLISWYQQGEDVQRLLHHLSVYMGHVHIAATQVYLTMTPELLDLANTRFKRYALGEGSHEHPSNDITRSLDSAVSSGIFD